MISKILGSFGGLVGNMLGGGIISTILRYAGRYLGNYIIAQNHIPDDYYHISSHLDEVRQKILPFAKPIPYIFGKAKVQGQIIWALDLREEQIQGIKEKYDKKTDTLKSRKHNIHYKYWADFAIAIAEGPISRCSRIWINGKEYDLSQYNYRFYSGSENQMPDPLILKHEKQVPAFRGLAYIVFEDFLLENFANKIPKFEFEITKKPPHSYADMVRNICIIPGSGEFVYDTDVIQREYYDKKSDNLVYQEYINNHNIANKADASYNLDNLQENFQNLEYVNLVVTWFIDDLDIAKASIYPAIEGKLIHSLKEWRVANFRRENARIVSKDADNLPNYGGTICDDSLVNYLSELKSRNIKILFNPIIFLDISGKAWRGHIAGKPESITEFFYKKSGYRDFILHYANLTKNYVDIFLIGSELKGITSIKSGDKYPAIDELICLAKDIKSILGANIAVSYAADWSEYHHHAGFYHLDKLWASEYIDFIGIDAYFPLTDTDQSEISLEEIKNGFESGEGYEYYIDKGIKKPLDPAWAWKNIRYWWENYHIHSNGIKSPWVPKSKKIIFTEFGFPSIDKSPNQPNIFYDPKCKDSGVPKHSTGEVDFAIQRKSIKAFLEYIDDKEFVEKSFLWCWDARPSPAWPHEEIWADSNLWIKGHWVNDKITSYNLGEIISELCKRSGIDQEKIVTDSLCEDIDGLLLDKYTSAWDVILMLQALYFFDIRSDNHGRIEFISRRYSRNIIADNQDLLVENNVFQIHEVSEENSISRIRISFYNFLNDYRRDYINLFQERKSFKEEYHLAIPILMTRNRANHLGRRILESARKENIYFSFSLPDFYWKKVNVGDVMKISYQQIEYKIRIIQMKYDNHKIFFEGHIDTNLRYGIS